jgi:phage-related baseplate assembly protein
MALDRRAYEFLENFKGGGYKEAFRLHRESADQPMVEVEAKGNRQLPVGISLSHSLPPA